MPPGVFVSASCHLEAGHAYAGDAGPIRLIAGAEQFQRLQSVAERPLEVPVARPDPRERQAAHAFELRIVDLGQKRLQALPGRLCLRLVTHLPGGDEVDPQQLGPILGRHRLRAAERLLDPGPGLAAALAQLPEQAERAE